MGKSRNSPLFHNIFNISHTSRVHLHIYLLNVVNRISFFLNSANLIYRGMDISKYFRESLGIRDNKSRLHLFPFKVGIFSEVDSAHVHARGRKQCCKLNYFLRRVSITPRLPFVCSLFPKAIFFTFILLQFFFMHLWFYVWRLWCPCLFVVSPSFGASRRLLCFVIVALPGNPHLYFSK